MHTIKEANTRSQPIMSLTGPVLREEHVRHLGKLLRRLLDKTVGRTLWVDMAEVECPTAAGMGQLVKLHKGLRAGGSNLVLCNVNASAYEVFEVTRLTDLLDIRQDELGWRLSGM